MEGNSTWYLHKLMHINRKGNSWNQADCSLSLCLENTDIEAECETKRKLKSLLGRIFFSFFFFLVGIETEQAGAHNRSNRLESWRLKSQVGPLLGSYSGLAGGTT